MGGGDDLVAGANAERFERQVQARGGGIDRHRVQRRVAEESGEIVFETLGLRPGRDPAGAQRVDDLVDLLLADLGQGEGEEGQLVGHGFQRLAIPAGTCPRNGNMVQS